MFAIILNSVISDWLGRQLLIFQPNKVNLVPSNATHSRPLFQPNTSHYFPVHSTYLFNSNSFHFFINFYCSFHFFFIFCSVCYHIWECQLPAWLITFVYPFITKCQLIEFLVYHNDDDDTKRGLSIFNFIFDFLSFCLFFIFPA